MPYSGCIENKQLYFFDDPNGTTAKQVCVANHTKYPPCPGSLTQKFPCSDQIIEFKKCPPGKKTEACRSCLLAYNKCLRSGEKICELPSLYSDMFCNKHCQMVDPREAAGCFTECKLALNSETECPFYMERHCKGSINCMKDLIETFEMTSSSQSPTTPPTIPPTTTPNPDEFFPEPTTEIPMEKRRHRRLEQESTTPIVSPNSVAAASVSEMTESIPSYTPPNYYQEEEKKSNVLLFLIIALVIIFSLSIVVILILLFLPKKDRGTTRIAQSIQKQSLPTQPISVYSNVFVDSKGKVPGIFSNIPIGSNPFKKKNM